MMSSIQSALFLGGDNLKTDKPIYVQGKLVLKMYLGDKLVYSLKQIKKGLPK